MPNIENLKKQAKQYLRGTLVPPPSPALVLRIYDGASSEGMTLNFATSNKYQAFHPALTRRAISATCSVSFR